MSRIKLSESPFSENPRRNVTLIARLSMIVTSFAVATNMLVLLENMNNPLHFPQLFVDTAMGRSFLTIS